MMINMEIKIEMMIGTEIDIEIETQTRMTSSAANLNIGHHS